MKTKKGCGETILIIILAGLLLLLIAGMVSSFSDFNKVYESTTTEELKANCLSGYSMRNIRDIPAKCLQFFEKEEL